MTMDNTARNQARPGGISDAISRGISWIIGSSRHDSPVPQPQSPPPKLDLDVPTERMEGTIPRESTADQRAELLGE